MSNKIRSMIALVGLFVVLFSIGSSVALFRTTETSSYWKESTSWTIKPNYEKLFPIFRTPDVGFRDTLINSTTDFVSYGYHKDDKIYNNDLYQLVSYPIKQFNIDSISFVHKNDTNEAIALLYVSYKKKESTVNFLLKVSPQFEAIQMPKFLNSTSFISSGYRYFSKQLFHYYEKNTSYLKVTSIIPYDDLSEENWRQFQKYNNMEPWFDK
jgi:hypothetical protein